MAIVGGKSLKNRLCNPDSAVNAVAEASSSFCPLYAVLAARYRGLRLEAGQNNLRCCHGRESYACKECLIVDNVAAKNHSLASGAVELFLVQ